jgi:hypothetical protein
LRCIGALFLALDPYLEARRGEVIENLCLLALGKLGAIEIDADRNATIGGARERLHYWPVRQDIGGHVDFVLGAIDKRHVDVFKIFARCIVNDRRWLGAARRERGAFLCADLRITDAPRADHAQYLASWLAVLKAG